MKRNILSKIVLIAVLIAAFGCKTKREAATKPSAKAVEKVISSKSAVLKSIKNQQIDFNTLSIKAKANLSIDNKDNDVSMNIRLKKDQAIWVSVTVIAGIEVARALITPDSVRIVNRLESEYTAKPFNFIHQFTNEQINFNTLQAMLVGNCIPEFLSENSTVNVLNDQPVLNGILKGLAYTVNFNTNYKVAQANLNDDDTNQKLSAAYSDFYAVSDRLIPHAIDIKSMAGDKNVNIDLKYNQVGVNEVLDFPFSVPKKFTVKD
jgi:hypothetical protein